MVRSLLRWRVSASASVGRCAVIVMAVLVSSASPAAARLLTDGPASTVRILVHYKPSTAPETYAQIENGLGAQLVGIVPDIHARVPSSSRRASSAPRLSKSFSIPPRC